jgi:predicted SAM-dependent methyltransferase
MKREVREAVHAVVQDTLSAANKPIAGKRFRAAVEAAEPGTARVVVGGGNITLPGWINTDVYWRTKYYLDLTKPWPVPSGSIDKIYADNVIEHFTLEVGRTVLKNMFEALRPGGTIRLATPDVERTARAYLDNGNLAATHLQRHQSKGIPATHPVDLLRVTFAEAKHYLGYCYDYAALSEEMAAVGFSDIHREEAGDSIDPAFNGLEARATDSERATALIVVASRSTDSAALTEPGDG